MTWWMEPSCSGGCDEGPYLGKITWPCPPNDCGWNYPPYPQRPPPPHQIPHPEFTPVNFPHPVYPGAQPMVWGPQTAVAGKGDCCGSCSSGHACESSCEDKKKHVGALYVSDDELNALGEQIAIMTGDVDSGADKEHVADLWTAANSGMKLCHAAALTWNRTTNLCEQTPDPTYASYVGLPAGITPSLVLTRFRNERWTPFALEWNAYRGQTIHEPTVFDTLRTKFASLKEEWTGPLKQTTRAVVPEREVSGFSWAGLPWGWIALGTGIVLLPFILPSLTALYLVSTRGSKLGLGGLI